MNIISYGGGASLLALGSLAFASGFVLSAGEGATDDPYLESWKTDYETVLKTYQKTVFKTYQKTIWKHISENSLENISENSFENR